jgi:hypothetical protein
MYIYVFLHYFLIYFIPNSFSHIFLLNNLFLWTIKYYLRVLLSFLVIKLNLVIYPLNFILKIVNNIRDITFTKSHPPGRFRNLMSNLEMVSRTPP